MDKAAQVTAAKPVKREVGQRGTYSGFHGTITEVCSFAPTMVVFLLQSGPVCVPMCDIKAAR